jgi:hypothetical protein
MNTIIPWAALIIALISSAGLLLHRDWRLGLGFLAIQYLSVFLLVQTHLPVSMAAAKLVTGWMACTVLGIAQLGPVKIEALGPSGAQGWFFRLFITGVAVAAAYALSTKAASWLGVDLPVAWGGLLLIGTGLIHLGVTSQPFRVILGLLTVLSGFDIVYASVESSALVAALLAAVTLGLALTGAFFLNAAREDAQ